MNKKFIWINTQFEGFHSYPNAPEEVSFLRSSHRHIFHVKVCIEVKHNERDIEFILFKHFVETFCIPKLNKTDLGSCETISDNLYKSINSIYPNRQIVITVSEDNENVCSCRYD